MPSAYERHAHHVGALVDPAREPIEHRVGEIIGLGRHVQAEEQDQPPAQRLVRVRIAAVGREPRAAALRTASPVATPASLIASRPRRCSRSSSTAPASARCGASGPARQTSACCGSQPLADHPRVERAHECDAGAVVDRPEARHDAPRAGVEERTREIRRALATDALADRRFADAQHDQIGRHVQVVDVVDAQEAVLGAAVLVVQRQHDAGELRMPCVEQRVRREVRDAVIGPVQAEDRVAIGLKSSATTSSLSTTSVAIASASSRVCGRRGRLAMPASVAARSSSVLSLRALCVAARPPKPFVIGTKHRIGE